MSGLDDLDDELLELAGGVQSGGEERQKKRQDSRDSSSRGSFSPTPPANTTSDKTSPRHDRKSTPHFESFHRRKDDSEEEGEAYTPHPLSTPYFPVH